MQQKWIRIEDARLVETDTSRHNGGNCHAAQQPRHWPTAAVNPTTTHTLGPEARAHLGRPIAININQVAKISKIVL